jgi:hypothetical protein
MHTRFALQTLLMHCMEQQKLDALVAPMSTVPPRKLLSPREPASNGRTPIGWFMFGQQGFPVIDVPAGFTTSVWDRERVGNETRLVGPIAAKLPVGVDFIARPFGEPTKPPRGIGVRRTGSGRCPEAGLKSRNYVGSRDRHDVRANQWAQSSV